MAENTEIPKTNNPAETEPKPQMSELPVEEQVKRQGFALQKIIEYINGNVRAQAQKAEQDKELKQRYQEWQKQYEQAKKVYAEQSGSRKSVFQTYTYMLPITAISLAVTAGLTLAGVQANGFLAAFLVSNIPTLIGSVMRGKPWYQKMVNRMSENMENSDPNYHELKRIADLNPMLPQNQKQADVQKFENGAKAADAADAAKANSGESTNPNMPPGVKIETMPDGRRVMRVDPNNMQNLPPEVRQLVEQAKQQAEQRKAQEQGGMTVQQSLSESQPKPLVPDLDAQLSNPKGRIQFPPELEKLMSRGG